MFEHDHVVRVDAAFLLVCIHDESFFSEGLYFIILVLEEKNAVVVLKGPCEWQAIVGSGSVRMKYYDVVFGGTCDDWIERIEAGGFFILLAVGRKTGLFILPGVGCK